VDLALREEVVSVGDLVTADEVVVTGSVRGVEPVRAYAGRREWDEGAVTPLLSAELRRVWLGGHDPVYTGSA
jgi:branched-subunit amino acid aminotransferase/4-amino-4-deoxychorismate lyase